MKHNAYLSAEDNKIHCSRCGEALTPQEANNNAECTAVVLTAEEWNNIKRAYEALDKMITSFDIGIDPEDMFQDDCSAYLAANKLIYYREK